MPDYAALRRRAFRWLLGGSSVSMLGSRLTAIAYPMLVLYLHGSPVMAGLAVFAATAPSVLCYIPAGALVDRWDPRKTILVSEICRGAAISVVVWAVLFHRATVPLIIAMAVIEEILEVFATLAERRYVRVLVDLEQTKKAQASIEARTHVIVLFGRTLGGALFAVRTYLPFLVDVATFGFSVLSLLAIGKAPSAHGVDSGHPKQRQPLQLTTELRVGVKWLWSDPYARDASSLSAAMSLVVQALIILFLTEATSRQLSPFAIGGVLAASGFGGALGSLIGQRLPVVRHGAVKLQPLIWSGILAVLAATSFMAPSGDWQVACTAVTMMVLGLTGAMGNVELDTYLARTVPYEELARVASVDMQLTFTAAALGPLLGGGLGALTQCATVGIGPSVLVLCVISAGCTWFAFRKPQALVPREITEPLLLAPAPTR